MSVEEMKIKIKEKYGENFIKGKSDAQIVAIYHNMVKRGDVKQYDPYKNVQIING